MNGKNKKLLWFEAGILIIALMTFSIGGSATLTNSCKNPAAQPTGIPWIDLKDSYTTDNNGYLILDFSIYYGTLPYTVILDYGDGSSDNITSDGHVTRVHKYETCRSEPYRIKVNATDNDDHPAWAESDAFFYCCIVDVRVSLEIDYENNEYPFNCEQVPIYFKIYVSSTNFFNAGLCDQYEVSLTVSSPDGAPWEGLYGPISPGIEKEIKPDESWKLEPGWHTACATVIPIGCTDNYQDNNKVCFDFYVFSSQACYILKILYNLFGRIFDSIFSANL